jgi:hypothetical protein
MGGTVEMRRISTPMIAGGPVAQAGIERNLLVPMQHGIAGPFGWSRRNRR